MGNGEECQNGKKNRDYGMAIMQMEGMSQSR